MRAGPSAKATGLDFQDRPVYPETGEPLSRPVLPTTFSSHSLPLIGTACLFCARLCDTANWGRGKIVPGAAKLGGRGLVHIQQLKPQDLVGGQRGQEASDSRRDRMPRLGPFQPRKRQTKTFTSFFPLSLSFFISSRPSFLLSTPFFNPKEIQVKNMKQYCHQSL